MIIYGKLVMHLERRYETDVGSVLLKGARAMRHRKVKKLGLVDLFTSMEKLPQTKAVKLWTQQSET